MNCEVIKCKVDGITRTVVYMPNGHTFEATYCQNHWGGLNQRFGELFTVLSDQSATTHTVPDMDKGLVNAEHLAAPSEG